MGNSETRPLVLPAGLGLESAAVRLGPRPLPFRQSPRGAWSTFGLRGRRYAWIREVEVRASRPQQDAAGIAATMRQADSMLRFWRDMPPLPTGAELDAAELARWFDYDEPPPEPPDAEVVRAEVEARVSAEVARAWPEPPRWTWLLSGTGLGVASGVGCAVTGLSPIVALLLAAGLGPALGAGLLAFRRDRRLRGIAGMVRARMGSAWAAHQERASASWRFERNEWELRRAQARARWKREELERIARVRRIRAGEPAAVRECLEATLADLDFPFEATCEVALGGDTAYLLVDLPDPSEVVPAVRAVVDADLEVEAVPVPRPERDEAYAELVAGVALLLGRATLFAAPALRTARVAAWRPRAGAPGAEYLLDVALDRDAAAFDPATVDPDAYVAILPGRFQQREDHRLAVLPEPSWIGEAFAAPAGRAAGAVWKN